MEFEFLGEVSGKSEKPSTTKPNDSGIEFEFLDKATEQPSGFLRQAADIPIQFAKGMGTGTRGITDVIGADNPVSKMIAGYEDYMDTLLSAESRNDSKRVAQMLQEAKDGGFLDKISAGFEAFASAPLETTANVAGYMVPQLAIGLVGKAAQLGKAAQVGLTLGTGFVQGVGNAKGNIYQNTKEYLREQGVPEDQIEPIAVKAQSYNGGNLDQLLLSGGLNALAAKYGAEAILTRVLAKEGKEVSGGIIGGILKGAAKEGSFESVQGIQEKTAENIPLQRLGYDVPTFQGAIESATTGLLAGGFVGGLAGGVEALSPEQKEQRDIDKEAERRARELEAGNAAAQAISTELTRLERGIDNKRMDLDALESTSPEASKMRLDIAADQKKLAVLKEQANKLGLSETITEAEKQQIEFGKLIAAPPEEKPAAPVTAPVPKAPTEPPVSMVGKQVIPGVTPVPVVAKAPTEPTVKESLTVAPVEEEPFGKLPTAEVETGISQRAKEAAIAEEREKIEAPIRRQESINQFLSEGATVKSRTNVVGRKKAAEGGGDITKTAYYLAHPDGKREITLSKKEASDLEAPAITPAPTPTEPATTEDIIGKKVTDSMGALPQKAGKAREALKGYIPIFKIGDFYEFIGEDAALSGSTIVGSGKSARSSLPYHQTSKFQEIANKTGKPIAIISNTKVSEVINPITPAPVAETPAVTEAPAAEVAPAEEGQFSIYQMERKDGMRWLVQSGEKRGFGDAIFNTKEDAEKYASDEKLRQQQRASMVEREAQIKRDEEAAKELREKNVNEFTTAIGATPIAAGKIKKTLMEKAAKRTGGKVYEGTRAEIVEQFVAIGFKPTIAQVDAVKDLTRAQFNRMDNRQQAEFEKKKKAAGKKNEYRLENAEGYLFDVTKAEYDYANWLESRTEIQPTPAVSETITPAAEVAPIQRDVTKPEQMTPEERGTQGHKSVIEQAKQDFELAKTGQTFGFSGGQTYKSKAAAIKDTKSTFERVSQPTEADIKRGASDHYGEINRAISDSNPVSAVAVDAYNITLPEGYIKQGELYVYQPEDTRKTKVSDTQYQTEGVVPKENRFTEDEVRSIINEIFEGKIPDRVKIIEDENNPNLDFKGAYSLRAGTITYNLAYLAKGDDLRFVTNHELGHFIMGDPKFQAEMARLFDSLPADIREKLIKAIDEAYMGESAGVRAEEAIVFAFGEILENAPDGRNILQRFLDAIVDAINRLLKTKGYVPKNPKKAAAAILLAARNRFEQGEFIRREDGSILRMTPTSPKDVMRDAEYLAAVERGDMETAQRMVDGNLMRVINSLPESDNQEGIPNTQSISSSLSDWEEYGLREIPIEYLVSRSDEKFPNYMAGGIERTRSLADQIEKEGVRSPMILVWENEQFPYVLEGNTRYDALRILASTGRQLPNTIPALVVVDKSADPVTYDDAGNVIPLSQRFQPSEPDIRRMAVERKKVMSQNLGGLKDTPKNIIAKTKVLLRERVFNPSEVTEQNTIEAFRALGKLTGNKQERRDFADELNDIATIVEDTGAAAEVSMGAALFVNDLFEYAVKLAAQGQKMMLGIMMTNINNLPTGTEGRSDAGRALRAAREMKDTFLTMAKAEQNAFINYAAEFVYGPNPTKEQVDSIRQGYEAVEEVEDPTEEDLGEELDKTGIQIGVDLVKKIEDDVKNAVAPERDPIVAAMLALQKLGGGTIETKYLPYSKRASSRFEGVKKILKGGLSNYRQKMVEGAATGLETGFWKTLSDEENKPGSLGELDAAQNRELGNIVKTMLISLGLKGEPPNTKMSIYEQVASILGERPLSNDKIKLADKNIREEIKRKREKELDATEDSDKQDAINVKYDGIESAWDQAMAQQLDMPISESTMRRLIFNELKEENTSIAKLTKLMNEEPAIATSRQDRLVSAIIEKIAGVTFEGQNPADYSTLKEYLSNQLDGLIQERQIKEAAAKAKAKIAKEAKSSVELQAEKAENEAQAQIEKLAKIQSDTPSFEVKLPAEAQMNPVREAVKRALKLNINRMFDPKQSGEIIANFKKSFVKELKELGVEDTAAGILADVVSRQIEINSMNNELKSIDRAIEKGPISEIIKAIKDTPLEEQQKPNWRYDVMRDYLRKAGLSLAQAERIAKLMDISLQKRFTQAKEQAFTDAISKTAPWKAGNVRSKRAFQQVLQAIRAGALDPSRNMASDIAALNGWTGFTADQYKNLLKFDTILADEKTGELEKANAYKGVQDIISKSKLPIRARDVIAQYYDAQALNGIPTLSVNSFSPIAFAMRNAIVEAGSETIKGDPKAIGRTATIFVDSIKSWANTVAFSFKNNVTVYSNVDYIVNDDNLLRLYRRGVDQFQKGNTPRDRADGIKNIMIGMMDYVRRVLNALDYGAIASLQNQNVGKYAMAVMKRNNISEKQANEIFGVMMKEKNDFYLNQIAIGTDKNKARILADEFYISSWKKALEKTGIGAEKIKSAMDSAINDAMSSVGRNRESLDAFREEATNTRDAGLASAPALWLLESIANSANQSNSQVKKLFARMIYGFAIVPARVIRETAWFSPYGLVRLAVDAGMRSRNMDSRYAQSLGTEFQRQQRLNEAVAGTVALVALLALRAGSTDDPEDEDAFKIVFTGNGPQRKDDAQFHDSWYKAGNKPNSMIVSFGKTKIPLNMMRGFEAFTWPAMMLGALDDLEIRKKQKQQTKTPAQLEDAAIVAGFVFDAALRRGPYAFTTKSLFGTYGDIGVEGVAKGLTFPAKTLIPVLGTSLASNLSNFLNDPIDRRTLDGAIWSNIPFIGPAVAPKSLNAFGEPSLSTDFASKMFKLGVPIVYDIPTDRESIKLHELVLKQGGGPSIPTRNQLAQRLDRQPTNKEYEMFVREYGTILTTSMKKNYDKLFNAKPEFYSKAVERIGNRARDVAENKVRQAAKKP